MLAFEESICRLTIYDCNNDRKDINIRCELCAFAEITSTDHLFCVKNSANVGDDELCEKFNITKQMKDDLFFNLID